MGKEDLCNHVLLVNNESDVWRGEGGLKFLAILHYTVIQLESLVAVLRSAFMTSRSKFIYGMRVRQCRPQCAWPLHAATNVYPLEPAHWSVCRL